MSITEFERRKQENILLLKEIISSSQIGKWAKEYEYDFDKELSKLVKQILIELDKQNRH